MFLRLCAAAFLSAFLFVPAVAQTIRFDTNVGTFDMELNPTGNPNLQGHVDNILAYVEAGRYDLTVINRAAENFVMQMGGFQLDTLLLPNNFSDFSSVPAFDPVIVDADNDGTVDFDVTNLLNTRGTVSLALSASANTGTSSFFVNFGTNTSLDAANLRFVPFASITDMATVDLIFGLPQANLNDGGLAGDDVPILEGNRLVFVERAFILETVDESLAAMMNNDGESLAGLGGEFNSNPPPSPQALSVPEPPALVLAAAALMAILVTKPSRAQCFIKF